MTAYAFFFEIFDLNCMLNDWKTSFDIFVMYMGINMKYKFDKYLGGSL